MGLKLQERIEALERLMQPDLRNTLDGVRWMDGITKRLDALERHKQSDHDLNNECFANVSKRIEALENAGITSRRNENHLLTHGATLSQFDALSKRLGNFEGVVAEMTKRINALEKHISGMEAEIEAHDECAAVAGFMERLLKKSVSGDRSKFTTICSDGSKIAVAAVRVSPGDDWCTIADGAIERLRAEMIVRCEIAEAALKREVGAMAADSTPEPVRTCENCKHTYYHGLCFCHWCVHNPIVNDNWVAKEEVAPSIPETKFNDGVRFGAGVIPLAFDETVPPGEVQLRHNGAVVARFIGIGEVSK
jgi:hypothetical protein